MRRYPDGIERSRETIYKKIQKRTETSATGVIRHMEEIIGNNILLLGYGREGKSTEAWLKKHYPSITIDIGDEKKVSDSYTTIIRSPGISPYVFKTTTHVTSATNIFFSRVKGMTIGVTGTKGKSTTSSLITHILKTKFSDVRLVGNIGKPMLDELDSATDKTFFVIELSSHQLVDIRYSPHIAVLLDIVPEHMDYYPDFETYKAAKANITKFQKHDDVAFSYPFTSFNTKTTLLGNTDNINAAVSVATYLKISNNIITDALATFSPLPHRLEYVGKMKGIRFYNDSLSTIPEATIHALKALGPDVSTLIAGGYDRNLHYANLGTYVDNHPVQNLILFPDTGEKIAHTITNKTINIFFVKSMKEAVSLAYIHTAKNNICLLSPASASYNLFRDYEERGDQFKEWVKKLG